MSAQPRIAVSACLLGQAVRYDGGHKRHRLLSEVLAPALKIDSVCPESELGLGTPRPPMHLGAGRRLLVTSSETDLTARMAGFAKQRCEKLPPLSGYVFKSKSPSCALSSVRVGTEEGGAGLFAHEFIGQFPLVPVVEESQLSSAEEARHFVTRVFAHARLSSQLADGVPASVLIGFHAAHKFSLLAHAGGRYKSLGRLVASLKGDPSPAMLAEYRAGFCELLAVESSLGKYVDALLHALGYFKRCASADERDGLRHEIWGVLDGRSQLCSVLEKIRAMAHRYSMAYLRQQYFFGADETEYSLLAACHAFFEADVD